MAVKLVEVILDTNIILRYLLKDLEDQYVAVQGKLKKLKHAGGVAVVFGEVVVECIHVMEKLYRMTRTDIVSILKPFLQTEVILLEDKNTVVKALSMYETTRLSYVDCLIIQKGRDDEIEIFTFDKKLLSKLSGPAKSGDKGGML